MDLRSLEQRLDKIAEQLEKLTIEMAVYNEQLKIHIKRTEHLEERVIPIEKHVIVVNGALKILMAAAAFGASIAGIMVLFK